MRKYPYCWKMHIKIFREVKGSGAEKRMCTSRGEERERENEKEIVIKR